MFEHTFASPGSPEALALPPFTAIYGVDFSGARLAGRTAWVARLDPAQPSAAPSAKAPFRLAQLASLESLCGTAERGPALAHLTQMIARSAGVLWALGFPFGLPIEVMEAAQGTGAGWPDQFAFLHAWGEDAYGMGVECLRLAKSLRHRGHIRRQTDIDAKAPWDTYSYRIIYQTFYGMRDVLGPLRMAASGGPAATVHEERAAYHAGPEEASHDVTAVLPFDYACLPRASRVVVEACPASTLKRLGLPHQNYKQTAGALTAKHRRVRREILAGLTPHVTIGRIRRRVLMCNPGGDALDAVIAAVGASLAWPQTDHAEIAAHPRFAREGRHYA